MCQNPVDRIIWFSWKLKNMIRQVIFYHHTTSHLKKKHGNAMPHGDVLICTSTDQYYLAVNACVLIAWVWRTHVWLTCFSCRHQVLRGAEFSLTTFLCVRFDCIVAVCEDGVGNKSCSSYRPFSMLLIEIKASMEDMFTSLLTKRSKDPMMLQHPKHWVSLLDRVLSVPPAAKHSSYSAICHCIWVLIPVHRLLHWKDIKTLC